MPQNNQNLAAGTPKFNTNTSSDHVKTLLKNHRGKQVLKDQFIEDQNVFDPKAIRALKKRLFSMNPGDAHATVWALIVFQWWWKKYF
jgi:hypothetical protein